MALKMLHFHSPLAFMVYTGENFLLPSTRTRITELQGK